MFFSNIHVSIRFCRLFPKFMSMTRWSPPRQTKKVSTDVHVMCYFRFPVVHLKACGGRCWATLCYRAWQTYGLRLVAYVSHQENILSLSRLAKWHGSKSRNLINLPLDVVKKIVNR